MKIRMSEYISKQKEALGSLNLTNEVIIAWLGIMLEDRTLKDEDCKSSISQIRELLENKVSP